MDIHLSKPVKIPECIQYLCFAAFFYVCREERKLKDTLDMRIGIHSGKILSGLLGVCKWQYDVWSRDVIIANNMEQAGKPGLVINTA
jgi:class 3 adenylate cyclase